MCNFSIFFGAAFILGWLMQFSESATPKAVWHTENESETWHCECYKIITNATNILACEYR